MGKGDHVVIPKATLKRFIGKDNKISELNLLNGRIRRVYPDSVFVELEYYDNAIDSYIKDNDEKILGELNKIISDNIGVNFKIKKNLIESMKKIFVIQHFRNNYFRKTLNKGKGTIEKQEHNFYLQQLIQYIETGKALDEKLTNIFKEMMTELSTYTPGFITLENTERAFVLPASQFAFISILGIDTYCMPIAPNVALIWRLLPEPKEIDYGRTSDNAAVDKINQLIIDFEKSKETDYLIYGKEDDINYYKNILFVMK